MSIWVVKSHRWHNNIDYRFRVTVPIRRLADMSIYCYVDMYGIMARDVVTDSTPLIHTFERLGLDPRFYVACLWDIPYSTSN